MKQKKGNSTQQQPLRKWLTGDANRHDERALDASAKDDPFLADALEGYRSLPEADHAADVTKLKVRLRKQSESRRGAGFYLLRIAAVGAVLVAAWVVLQQFQSSENAAAVADATSAEAPPAASETEPVLADSAVVGIASQQKTEAAADDDRVAVQESFSSKTKKVAPQSQAQANDEAQNFSTLKEEPAAAEAPPPVAKSESKPTPTQSVDAALAIEATQAAPQKDEDLAKAKASRAETKKLADTAPLRMPAAPATALRQITGKVTDESGQPLAGGAYILAKGTDIGTISDIDGNYSIDVPKTAATLVFSSNPYGDIQIGIGKKDNIDVSFRFAGNFDIDVLESIVPANAVDAATGPITPPQPTGGFSAYLKYLDENKLHPEAGKQPRPAYIVKVGFTLQEDGTLTNFTSKSKAPQAYIDETIRLLKEGPRWEGTPGATAVLYYGFR